MLLALMAGRALTAGELAMPLESRRKPRAGTWASSSELGFSRSRSRAGTATSVSLRPRSLRCSRVLWRSRRTERPVIAPLLGATKRYAKRGPATTILRVVSVWRLRTPFSHEGISYWMTTAGKSPLTALGFTNEDFGLNLADVARQRRRFCRPCLDWSERRRHLGGAVGAAVAARCFKPGWIDRTKGSRAVAITSSGRRGFFEIFGIPILDDRETIRAEG